MTDQEILVRYLRIVTFGPIRSSDDDWTWAQENHAAVLTLELKPQLARERDLACERFIAYELGAEPESI
jgi:hypothetical protein